MAATSSGSIADRNRSVIDAVARVRQHPLVPRSIPIYGYVYDVKTGRLIEVPQATEAGQPA
jgi:carbonic anhydrase